MLQADSTIKIVSQLQGRLSLAQGHDSSLQAPQLHSDIPKLAAISGGNPRLLEVLLAAGAAYKAQHEIEDRYNVSREGLCQLLEEGLPHVGGFEVVLKNAARIAMGRRDETLKWSTKDLQMLLAELLRDVMTQRTHKRAQTMKLGARDVSYDKLMGEGTCPFI